MTEKSYGGGKFIPNVYVIDQQGAIHWQRAGNMDLAGEEAIVAEFDKLLAAERSKMWEAGRRGLSLLADSSPRKVSRRCVHSE